MQCIKLNEEKSMNVKDTKIIRYENNEIIIERPELRY